jgi:hypothetical protein
MCNLKVIEPSRKKIHAGDIFAMTFDFERFLYGRVIYEGIDFGLRKLDNGIEIPGWPKCTFIYIYKVFSSSMENVPRLERDQLLIAPRATNHIGWRRGYFRTVANAAVVEGDVLPQHCFSDRRNGAVCYFDLQGKEIPARIEPCGEYALLDSYRTIDDAICEALGIPLAP